MRTKLISGLAISVVLVFNFPSLIKDGVIDYKLSVEGSTHL